MSLARFFPLFLLLLTPLAAHSKPLQIIYTNDLHSFLETSEHAGWGGYAAVKATIDRLRSEAQARGIESVVLDAGDFSEGSPFFFSDRGRQSWRIVDAMGFDAVTIGNHDWLIGAGQMNAILGEINPATRFLAANMKFDKKYKALRSHIGSHIELERDGIRIAVLGVTTDELVYRWRMAGGGIDAPMDAVAKLAPRLKARNDLVIGLTHVGVMEDIKIVGATRGLDLVVGGHSHTKIGIPLMIKNRDQVPVPVVQAGMHGEWVGQLVVDVNPGQAPQVLHSELVAVTSSAQSDGAPAITQMVSDARSQLEDRYSAAWLYDTVGFTELGMDRPIAGYTQWGNFALHSLREAAGADIAVDPGEFFGSTQPPGVITNETIMKSYPRVFDVNQAMGWTLWKVKVPGWMLKYVLEYVTNNGLHLNVAGLTFDADSSSGKVKVKNLRINGNAVKPFKTYSVAVTEGIGRGAVEISILLQLAFSPKNTGIPVWRVLEEKLRSLGGNFGGQSYLTPSIGVQ